MRERSNGIFVSFFVLLQRGGGGDIEGGGGRRGGGDGVSFFNCMRFSTC